METYQSPLSFNKFVTKLRIGDVSTRIVKEKENVSTLSTTTAITIIRTCFRIKNILLLSTVYLYLC